MAKLSPAFVLSSVSTAMLLLAHPAADAQDGANVLGLPAVPQTPQVVRPSPSSSKPAAAPGTPNDSDIKSALSGNISLASFYQVGLVTVRVTTTRAFVGNAPRAQALQAARLIQRDVRIGCGKLCKPGPMPAPSLLANNTLSFDMVISGYVGTLSTADMVNLLNAKAIGPGGKAAPAPVPVPVDVKASTASAAPLAAAPSATASSAAPTSATVPP